MLLVFTITEKTDNSGAIEIQTKRTYCSKDSVLQNFLLKNVDGETETETHKLSAYNHTIKGGQILAINRHAGTLTKLEVLHSDQVNEI